MIAKIALMLGAIWVVTMMVVSYIAPCIAVGANQTRTSNCSNLRNKNGEKEMEKEGRKGKNFFEGESVGNQEEDRKRGVRNSEKRMHGLCERNLR